jgi:hypothetical protein
MVVVMTVLRIRRLKKWRTRTLTIVKGVMNVWIVTEGVPMVNAGTSYRNNLTGLPQTTQNLRKFVMKNQLVNR